MYLCPECGQAISEAPPSYAREVGACDCIHCTNCGLVYGSILESTEWNEQQWKQHIAYNLECLESGVTGAHHEPERISD